MTRLLRIPFVLALILSIAGCDAKQVLKELAEQAPKASIGSDKTPRPTDPEPTPVRQGNTIKIASFNIQVFGTSKLAKPEVMVVLTKVVRRFDIVAVQEIRSKDETVVPRFLQEINAVPATSP